LPLSLTAPTVPLDAVIATVAPPVVIGLLFASRRVTSTAEVAAPSATRVLGVAADSTTDLFAAGGDGRAVLRLREELAAEGWTITASDILSRRTPQLIAGRLSRQDAVSLSPQGEITGPVDLTPSQARWAADRATAGQEAAEPLVRWAWIARLGWPGPAGAPAAAPDSLDRNGLATHAAWGDQPEQAVAATWDIAALRQALAAVLRQHDALRAVLSDGYQVIAAVADTPAPPLRLNVAVATPSSAAVRASAQALAAALDPGRGALVGAHVWRLPDGDRLLLAVHGFAADSIGFGHVVADVVAAHDQAAAGRPIDLGVKTASLRAWTHEAARFLGSSTLGGQLDFWLDQAETIRQAQLPLAPRAAADRPGARPTPDQPPTSPTPDTTPGQPPDATPDLPDPLATLTADLEPDLTARLLTDALHGYGATAHDLVVAAAVWAAHEVFGLDALALDVEGDGRQLPGDPLDLSRTVGWLASAHPLVVPAGPVTGAAIVAAKEAGRAVPTGGLGHALLLPLGIPGLDVQPHLAVRFDPGPDPASLGPGAVLVDWPVGSTALAVAPVTLSAVVRADRLALSLVFPPDRLGAADAWRFLVALRDGLISVIEHCAAMPTTLRTASDVGLPDLDDATIARLNAAAADPQDYR